MHTLRLIIVADIHHGAVNFSKQGPQALGLLDAPLNASREADALIDLGDRITDADPATDRKLEAEVAARLAESACPVHSVNGNHDRMFLTESDNDLLLGRPTGHRVVDLGAVRAVFWQPDVTLTSAHRPRLAAGDLAALERMLAASDKRTLLFTHIPLCELATSGAYWFDNNRGFSHYATDQAEIRQVLAQAPCPILALAGHVHVNTLTTVDGTPHLTQQSLSDSWPTDGSAACGAWGVLEVSGEAAHWRVEGLDPLSATVPFPTIRRRWPKPLPPFESLRGVTAAPSAA